MLTTPSSDDSHSNRHSPCSFISGRHRPPIKATTQLREKRIPLLEMNAVQCYETPTAFPTYSIPEKTQKNWPLLLVSFIVGVSSRRTVTNILSPTLLSCLAYIIVLPLLLPTSVTSFAANGFSSNGPSSRNIRSDVRRRGARMAHLRRTHRATAPSLPKCFRLNDVFESGILW